MDGKDREKGTGEKNQREIDRLKTKKREEQIENREIKTTE